MPLPDVVSAVCGVNDINIKTIERILGAKIAVRGCELRLCGKSGDNEVAAHHTDALPNDSDSVETKELLEDQFKNIIENLAAAAADGETPSVDYVKAVAKAAISADSGGSGAGIAKIRSSLITIPHGFGSVFARSANQAEYIGGMRKNDICFCVGPAGTGKTYLAIAYALSLVLSKKIRKLVLTRPVVEAGESLGFLPGDLAQKINPYLRPLYDAMESLIPYNVIMRMEDSKQIEIAPLAYMRGRSLNDAFIILDEAQNTTKEQMKMFLTRLGNNSRALITGDVTQVDLPARIDSGLLHALSILNDIKGIHFAYLNTADVVRHPLIKKIISAYEKNATVASGKR
ncbi:MAG: PhoH family protein [Termitinemataceae bacterium]|nr:MAG: PhoH family protein [Termitinemataceae bacterium]